ncbi:EamA family transporter [Nesterenkonia pannonica]|uniref:EamA family transporter n=1 Tax=Nesterenkonia pannonica TaxID=1548602 RepID=UPI0021647B1F|nr:EamA family transporter [Nesterenkonia pannonica]
MWMTVVPPLPLFTVSLLVEGPEQIAGAVAASWSMQALPGWGGLVYTMLFGTILGSGIWVWLMRRHPAGVVAPFSMLVPVVGILAAWAVLGQAPTWLQLFGGVLVLGGVLWSSMRWPAGRSHREPPGGDLCSEPSPDS